MSTCVQYGHALPLGISDLWLVVSEGTETGKTQRAHCACPVGGLLSSSADWQVSVSTIYRMALVTAVTTG